ncbi:hypothetical protein JHU38_03620 [Prevotella sp. A2931]|uniref:Polysaccharide biosynthesis protein n=1 Tax=Prevotella illustrans TaxID=2800387 RepID=A0ABS3M3X7_9BACT|nr:hypothetical protein [Prevotella illustrans]PTL27275.1 hypothetical protein C3V39_01940 [Prevotella sp. oral taxon 820]
MLLSFAAKAISILSSLLIIPLTINYVNPTQYGVWLTLSSVIGWISYFDLGLGNGFRNRFTKARADGDDLLATKYLSTTYFCITAILVCVFFVVLVLNNFVNWASFLRISQVYQKELHSIFSILCFFFCLNMVTNIFGTMLIADQKPGLNSMIQGGGQLLSLLVIFILTKVSSGSLLNLALFYSGVPCILMLITSILAFKYSRYHNIRPRLSLIRFSLIKDILSLGIQFFLIYICLIAIFQIINIVIAKEIGPIGVTQYNIASRYFNILYMLIIIVITPFWSAFTDAFTKQDYKWMRSAVKKLERVWLISILAEFILLAISPFVYHIWIGKSVHVPFLISVSVCLFISSQSIGTIYMYLINGIGKIRIQTIIYVIFAISSWSTMVYASKHWGINGIILLPTIVYIIQAIFGKIQLSKILEKKDRGLWAK